MDPGVLDLRENYPECQSERGMDPRIREVDEQESQS